MGDDRPGTVTGKQRFTYSQAIRRNDGSIRAVMVVAIYRSNFDALYGEAANWPGATAGLQTMEAAPLARFDPDGAASSPGYLRSLTEHARQYEAGSAIIIAGNEPRLTSWKRSTSHPEVYGSSSQPVEEALRNWKVQAWTVGLLTIAANLAFIAFAIYLHRASQSRQAALANELAVREVNHRVKNSLQLISSLLHMRARKSDDEGYRRATEDVTNHLTALAETYRVVQSATTLESVDINTTLKGLCAHLQQTYDTSVKLEPGTPIMIDAAPATTLAVIVNELVCNGIKHGEGQVTVSCEETQETLRIAVRNSGPPLPEEFSLEEVKGFGLKAVNAMAVGLGGKLSVVSSAEGGAMFEVAVPREALHRKAKAYSI
jgi:two-component sensor histidine kinase